MCGRTKMIAFTDRELNAIRTKAKAHPAFLRAIERSTEKLRQKLYIQRTARATWSQYYLCPKHSVPLEFDYSDPDHYRCPIDGAEKEVRVSLV